MTKVQIATILIFLKEAGHQINNAYNVAKHAGDPQTMNNTAALLQELSYEITRLNAFHQKTR